MIQISFTRDLFTPSVVYFNPDWDEKPHEYQHHFCCYRYYSDKEALAILDDKTESVEVKKAIAELRQWLDLELEAP